jgi:DNA-directed RNA polymerase I subunit RPA43
MSPTAITSTPMPTSSKKRKHHESPNAATSSKKLKTAATTETEAVTSPEQKKKKSKKHRKVGEEFKRIQARMTISLPPIFVQDPTEGIEEMLDSMILRYVLFKGMQPHESIVHACPGRFVPSLNGVVLAHSNLRLSSEKAAIQFDCPYATCHITFEALVWSPAIGMKLCSFSYFTTRNY